MGDSLRRRGNSSKLDSQPLAELCRPRGERLTWLKNWPTAALPDATGNALTDRHRVGFLQKDEQLFDQLPPSTGALAQLLDAGDGKGRMLGRVPNLLEHKSNNRDKLI